MMQMWVMGCLPGTGTRAGRRDVQGPRPGYVGCVGGGGAVGLPVARTEGRPRVAAGTVTNNGEDREREGEDDIGVT